MELRLLYGNELQWALYTANEVFETCIRPVVRTQEVVEQYYRYARVEYLWQEMSTGRLFLWGAFENGQMCAVSAMQNTGHITMLYVRRQHMRRRVGMRLLDEMSGYASAALGKDRVTLDVVPAVSAPYFYHVGFVPVLGASSEGSCVHLERRIWTVPQSAYPGNPIRVGGVYGNGAYEGALQKRQRQEITYPVKKVSAKLAIGLVAGVFVLMSALVAGTTIYHIAEDGLWTEEGK